VSQLPRRWYEAHMGTSVLRKEMLGGSGFGYGSSEFGVVGLEFVEHFVALGVEDC
jgi:hypothetical protein